MTGRESLNSLRARCAPISASFRLALSRATDNNGAVAAVAAAAACAQFAIRVRTDEQNNLSPPPPPAASLLLPGAQDLETFSRPGAEQKFSRGNIAKLKPRADLKNLPPIIPRSVFLN